MSTENAQLHSKGLGKADPLEASLGVFTHGHLNCGLSVCFMLENKVSVILNNDLIVLEFGDTSIDVRLPAARSRVGDRTSSRLILRNLL